MAKKKGPVIPDSEEKKHEGEGAKEMSLEHVMEIAAALKAEGRFEEAAVCFQHVLLEDTTDREMRLQAYQGTFESIFSATEKKSKEQKPTLDEMLAPQEHLAKIMKIAKSKPQLKLYIAKREKALKTRTEPYVPAPFQVALSNAVFEAAKLKNIRFEFAALVSKAILLPLEAA